MKKLSIKARVTLWFTIVMLIIVVMTFWILLFVSGVEVSKNYNKQLQETVMYDTRQIEYDDGILEFEDDFISYKSGIFIFVYDMEGNMLLGQAHNVPAAPLPLNDDTMYEVMLNDEKYIVYDRLTYVEDYDEVWIRGMMEKGIGSQKSTKEIVIQIAFVGFPILLVLATSAGYVLTKQSFKPIERIINSAEAINEGKDLSKRIGLDEGHDEIYRLAHSFDKMFERLEAAFEMEKKFTSDASHELRTPTAVILSQCEYILEEDRPVEEYKEALRRIERQGYKMSKLISQLLAFTRLEQGMQASNKTKVNLSELVTSICEEQAYLSVKGIKIKSDVAANVYAYVDATLISRVLINFISNAYKYGRENGTTLVNLKEQEGCIYLSVEDNGIGIKEEDLPKIWRRFYRVDASRTSDGNHSMGLGLAMVKQIAALHDGEVSVDSKWGEGSKFTLVLKKSNS